VKKVFRSISILLLLGFTTLGTAKQKDKEIIRPDSTDKPVVTTWSKIKDLFEYQP